MPGKRPLSTNDQEHLRLLKALRESELLREFSALLASSLDPSHILQVLVKRTTDVCDVERCAVWLLDEARSLFVPSAYHLSATHLKKHDIERAEQIWQHSSLALDHPVIHRLLHENSTQILNDMRQEPGLEILAEKFFIRSILLVALRREDRTVGIMSLDNPGKRCTFSQDQQQLAHAIGQQASVAIGNAHLYQQAQAERRRAERLIGRAQSIYQVAMAVNSGENLTKILDIAAEQLVHGLDAKGAAIALLEADALSVVSTTGLCPSPSTPRLLAPALTDLPHCLTAILEAAPCFVTTQQVEGAEQLWYRQLGLENVMVIPLMVGRQHTNGEHANSLPGTDPTHSAGFAFVNYAPSHRHPTPGQYAFAQDIAAQCALAIEKNNLLARAHQSAVLANERANTLNAVFNAMTEGITLLNLDGQVVISNKAASHFLGVPLSTTEPLDTLLQRYPTYTLQGQPLRPEDFPLARALRGEQIRGERFMTRRADGSERSLDVNVAQMFDSEGRQIGLVSAFRDITEQVRVERRIRQALETMLHAVKTVSGITDIGVILQNVLEMTLTALNSERGVIQLYDHEQQEFTSIMSLGFSPEEEAQWVEDQQNWLEPGEGQYAGFRRQLLDGHATLINEEQCPEQPNPFKNTMILATPIIHNNHLLGVMMLDRSASGKRVTGQLPALSQTPPMRPFNIWDLAIIEGIAQFAGLAIEQARWQQEAEIARTNEEMMRASNDLKDEFLDITAHEFRTPLTVILAYSQMMERILRRHSEVTPEVRDKLNESLSTIEVQAHQLTNIVNTFLEVTRLNRGQIVLSTEKIDLEEVVKQAVTDHSSISPIHHIQYSTTQSERPFLLLGDKARLLQILANLLQNAIKYSPQGGPVTVTLSQGEDDAGEPIIEVRVKDCGIGIPLDAQPRLFERFYRAPNIESSKTRGVGLGLYVVAEFMRLHSGTIRVESSGIIGEGSCFILTLPLLVESNISEGTT